MVSSGKRGAARRLFPMPPSPAMAPWYFGTTHTTLYNLLAAFIGGQILLTAVFLMRSAPPCDCRCQWRPELEEQRTGKAGRSVDAFATETLISGLEKSHYNQRENHQLEVDDFKDETIQDHSQKLSQARYVPAEFVDGNAAQRKDSPNPQNPIMTRGDKVTLNGYENISGQILVDARVMPNESIAVKSESTAKRTKPRIDVQVVEILPPFTILTTTNTAFSDLTENWLESLRRLGLAYNITLIAEDSGAFFYFTNRKSRLESSGLTLNLRYTDKNASSSDALGFHTRDYIQLVGKRPHYILDILRSGVGVLFADADAVWLKDPIPLIAKSYGRYDIWVALGEGGQIPCPCFMYLTPTPRAIGMVRAWQERIEDQLTAANPENDQTALAHVMNNHVKYRRLRVRKLDLTAFPTGQSMFLTKGWYATHKDDIYVVHANKIGGYAKKKFVLKWKKLWYLGKDQGLTHSQ